MSSLIRYKDLGGREVDGAIWSDAPKPGCKWVTPSATTKGRRIMALVKRDGRTGKWEEVAQ
jgi:hypothetical protein